ncbi:MAG: preprotein translocase subunit SecA, partial [Akkermansia sp.]|nr:preprotein translocase subunit SecA [Akkermansia sp.]
RTIVYGMRNEALLCEEPRQMLYEVLDEGARFKCDLYLNEDNTGSIHRSDLLQWVNSTFPMGWGEKDVDFDNMTPDGVADKIIARVREMYEKKVEGERADRVDQMERSIMLQSIDKLWQQHITDMDALREGVRLRAQGQRDPLVEYKREAYELFESLMHNIQMEMLSGLFRSTTSLDAFEEFLASLPSSNADDEDADVTDILGNGDLLSALREQMEFLQRRQQEMAAQQQAPATEPAVPAIDLDEAVPMNESLSGAAVPDMPIVPEKKLTLPRKKVTFNPSRREKMAPVSLPQEALAPEGDGLTMGSIDSGNLFDGPESDEK